MGVLFTYLYEESEVCKKAKASEKQAVVLSAVHQRTTHSQSIVNNEQQSLLFSVVFRGDSEGFSPSVSA